MPSVALRTLYIFIIVEKEQNIKHNIIIRCDIMEDKGKELRLIASKNNPNNFGHED